MRKLAFAVAILAFASVAFALGAQITAFNGFFSSAPPNSGGSYADTYYEDSNYWYFGSNSDTDPNFLAVFDFNGSLTGVPRNQIADIQFRMRYCYSGSGSAPPACGRIDGAWNGDQGAYIYNWTSGSWVSFSDVIRTDYSGTEEVSTFWSDDDDHLPLYRGDYVNPSNGTVRVGLEVNVTNDATEDSWMMINRANISVTYYKGRSVVTDRPYYKPNETMGVTGYGWTPNASITLILTRKGGIQTDNWTTTADTNGIFSTTRFVGLNPTLTNYTLTARETANTTNTNQTLLWMGDYIYPDDFNDGTLSEKWIWYNEPAVWDESQTLDGWFHIRSDRDTDFWRWNDNGNLIYQMQGGDFNVEYNVNETPIGAYVQGGLHVRQDRSHWLKIAFTTALNGTFYMESSRKLGNDAVLLNQTFHNINPFYLRLRRVGNVFTTWWSSDGTNWTMHANFTYAMDYNLGIGLYAADGCTDDSENHDVWFDYYNFQGNRNSTLLIYSTVDRGAVAYPNDTVYFFANYFNTTSNRTINGTCNITFNVSGNWTAPIAMTYNTTTTPYYYSRAFNNSGVYVWNVTCAGAPYAAQNKSTVVEITEPTAPTVSVGKPSYAGSAPVYYRARLYNSSGGLINDTFDTRITDPISVIRQVQTGLYPNNGTGTYNGFYCASAASIDGPWLISTNVQGATKGTGTFQVVH